MSGELHHVDCPATNSPPGECVCESIERRGFPGGDRDTPSGAHRSVMQARIAQHLKAEGSDTEFALAGVYALEAMERGQPDVPVTLPTGMIKRAREVVEMLGLTPFLLGR